jgi:hypothetical protein
MAVVCRTYAADQDARSAVEALLAAGVPGDRIQVLMGEPEHDSRVEHHGSFAEAAGEEAVGDAPVSDFAGQEHPRGAGRGTFAGEAGLRRGGSFADADREVITSYPGGIQEQHVTGHAEVRRLLLDAGLDKKTADRDVDALHAGRVLVVAEIGDREPAAAFGE